MEINILELIENVRPFINPGLLELVAIGDQITTPDGRWEAFQEWLRRNPKWRKNVNAWMKLDGPTAYIKLKDAIIADASNPAMIKFAIKQFVTPSLEARIIRAIEALQRMYTERKKLDSKTSAKINQ